MFNVWLLKEEKEKNEGGRNGYYPLSSQKSLQPGSGDLQQCGEMK